MTSRSHVAAFAALAFLTLATLAPLAVADHAYSHRYVVYGRVIDAENNPVPGLTVDVGTKAPFKPEGPCANQPNTETEAFGPTRTQPVTNALGEFIFCFHTHGMSRGTPGEGIVRIDALNFEKTVTFDGFMRYSFIDVRLPTASPVANKTAANEIYTVMGRVWEASDQERMIEQVGVYGDTVHGVDYNLTVTIDGEAPQEFTGRTNGYGDFAIRVPVDSRPTGGNVVLKIDGETFEAPIDGALGVTHIRGQIGELKTTPGAPLFALLALVAVAAVAIRARK